MMRISGRLALKMIRISGRLALKMIRISGRLALKMIRMSAMAAVGFHHIINVLSVCTQISTILTMKIQNHCNKR